MKKVKILLLVSIFLLLTISLNAGNKGNIGRLYKPTSVQVLDTEKRIDVNNIDMFVTNLGSFAWDLQTGEAGLIFPRGTTKTAVYASGLWIGARVNGQIRVAVSEYSQEYIPGLMKDSTFDDPNDAAYRVYKLNRFPTAEQMQDYNGWPAIQGAPVDSLGKPAILGDQFLYCVYNDADPSAHTNDAGSTPPLGVEVHQSTFAFARGGALGNSIIVKFKVINRGPNVLDSTYFAIWSDPDLGGASDDLVGCDTLFVVGADTVGSLGYCYNANNNDQLYDGAPPAVGYDFFQGPIIPGDSTDTALVSGEKRPGFKNLPMTAFNKYINGTDPRNFIQAYQYLKGLNAVEGQGAPYINPVTSETTTFAMTGDPVAGTGWLDANPADRRLMLCSGPFTMNPGDTQEVVVGIIIGQGTDRLSSITALRNNDIAVQKVFNLNFVIPPPPPVPSIHARAYNEGIDLVWGTEADTSVEISVPLDQEFHFEGFNLWQGESPAGPWKKIATYDIDDDIQFIYADVFDPNQGGIVRQLVQVGNNTGLVHHFFLDKDYLHGGKLINGKTYYFAVTAYSYDVRHVEPYNVNNVRVGDLTESLEYPPGSNFVAIEPLSSTVLLADTAHHSGPSEGFMVVDYLKQDSVTGDEYKVTINGDRTWNLIDVTKSKVLLTDQPSLWVFGFGEYTIPIVNGFMIRVIDPYPIRDFSWTPGPDTSSWFTGYNWGGYTMDGGLDIAANLIGCTSIPDTGYHDVEIRFSPTNTQKAYDYLRHDPSPRVYDCLGYFDVPFTVWDVTDNPPRQLNAAFVEAQLNGKSTPTLDSAWLPDSTTDGREYLIVFKSTYSATLDTFYFNRRLGRDCGELDMMYILWPIIRKGHKATELADGQVLRINHAIVNSYADTFTFKTHKAGEVNGSFVAKTLDNIWVVPNPFYHRAYTQGPFEHAVQFMNLPPNKWTIKIFNIAGDLVRTLEQEDPQSSVYFWDLLTDKGLPVASGIYIYYIEADELGSTFGKMAIFMEEERLRTF